MKKIKIEAWAELDRESQIIEIEINDNATDKEIEKEKESVVQFWVENNVRTGYSDID